MSDCTWRLAGGVRAKGTCLGIFEVCTLTLGMDTGGFSLFLVCVTLGVYCCASHSLFKHFELGLIAPALVLPELRNKNAPL